MRRGLLATSACVVAGGLAALGVTVVGAPVGAPSALATHASAKDRAAAKASFVAMMKSNQAPMVRATGADSFPKSLQSQGKASTNAVRSGTGFLGSYNWSGYAIGSLVANTGTQNFTSVSGSWHVLPTTCNTRELRFNSEWVGIDGFNDGTVEQLGTSAYCYLGRAYYYSWWEMFPGGSVTVITVRAGDAITASVVRHGTTYTLKLTDRSSRQGFTETEQCPPTYCYNASAEWVMERPAFTLGGSGDYQFTPLARFSYATFTTMKVSSAKYGLVTASPATFSAVSTVWTMDMLNDSTSYFLASTGALSKTKNTGTAFTTEWLNSF